MKPKLLAIISAIALIGCNSDRIGKLEKQNQEILSRLDKLEKASVFGGQTKCSRDAKTYYKDEYVSPKAQEFITDRIFFSDYQSHYSEMLNGCFLRVEQHERPPNASDPSFDGIIAIADVYEHREVGRYHQFQSYIQGKSQVDVSDCQVDGNKCSSLAEFDKRSEPYTTK